MKVFFDPRQVAKNADSYSPSAGKPGLVVESWQRLGIPFEIKSFQKATFFDMCLAHDPSYIKAILSRRERNGFGNKRKDVADSLPWVCGSMIAAAVHAFKSGETAFSPTSGAHHAGYGSGGGFCTFNSLIMAARVARHAGADKVAIIDMDCHWGNGTAAISDRLRLGDWLRHYSFGRQRMRSASSERFWPIYGVDPDLGKNDERSVRGWLDGLEASLLPVISGCDLVLFNAGVDSHVDDPLGGFLSTEEMAERDDIVLRVAHELNVPVALALAGGYQVEANGSIDAVLRLHDETFRAAVRYDRGRFGQKYWEGVEP
jgi:acetoin utilization deacetylase AcuC-like enzyme